jgi:hypothetical protein
MQPFVDRLAHSGGEVRVGREPARDRTLHAFDDRPFERLLEPPAHRLLQLAHVDRLLDAPDVGQRFELGPWRGRGAWGGDERPLQRWRREERLRRRRRRHRRLHGARCDEGPERAPLEKHPERVTALNPRGRWQRPRTPGPRAPCSAWGRATRSLRHRGTRGCEAKFAGADGRRRGERRQPWCGGSDSDGLAGRRCEGQALAGVFVPGARRWRQHIVRRRSRPGPRRRQRQRG